MSDGRNLRLSREGIESALRELGAELLDQDARAELFVVGGAVMALAYNVRRVTADVEAIFEPKALVYAAARRVAARRPELPDDWLNDAVKGFLPGTDHDATVALDAPGVRVTVASPPYLLALKVLAARQDRDADDLRELATLCGAATAAEILQIAEQYVGADRLTARARFMVEELFPS
jgi:predicted nucleotidyltransferase